MRYGKLPSEIKDRSMQDFQFDLLVFQMGLDQDLKDEKKRVKRALQARRGGRR